MAKQLNVNLSFNADVKQAQAQIQALQKSLEQVAKLPGKASSLFDDVNIRKASAAALELEQHLSKAVNVDTGKLDLSRFSSSLKASNKSLSDYTTTLLSVGETGQQAFLQLATSIASAETPVTRVNARLQEFATTLKNTARWQISSSILHGFMGAVQSAYGYAQDLNESLNNIRIVTGQSVEEMDRFAERANRAAKLLSTTTVEYTDAALIYYQQGLTDEQVAERTAVTVKMANAAGQSAQVVSDQLTAVWNNFYDGSKALEYYADVMTALGAATASSTDEIAGGLEKFAAIADTIGLSYEYAASALATITSNTRQSEEVVGTALKTIFARIQGLNLGETLEDGTTLNRYSKALDAVGINIFDANKNIKSMDALLDEIAVKWQQISKDQQIALAQTVAGTRQYTQLVALMDNWNNGDNDSMVANLSTARGSEGALTEQADIYAESWEAASDRVTAAAENIYDSLLDDDFFITILNGFEDTLESIGGIIDGLGGMEGALSLVGSIFLKMYANKMPGILNNLKQNLMVFTGQAKSEMSKLQSQLDLKLTQEIANPNLTESYKIQLEGISKVNNMKQKLTLASKNLTEQEKEEYQAKIKNVETMYEEVAILAKQKQETEKVAKASQKILENNSKHKASKIFDDYGASEQKVIKLEEKATTPGISGEKTEAYVAALEKARIKAVNLEEQITEIGKAANLTDEQISALMGTGLEEEKIKAEQQVAQAIKETSIKFSEQLTNRKNLDDLNTSVSSQATAWREVGKAIEQANKKGNYKEANKAIDETKQKMQQYLIVLRQIAVDNGLEETVKEIDAIDLNNINIDEAIKKFLTLSNIIKTETNVAIDQLDEEIEQTRKTMDGLQFNSEDIKQFENDAEQAADAAIQLKNSMDNIKGVADENLKGNFHLSTFFSDFASALMDVNNLLNTFKNSFSIFTDENVTGFEKFGAAISIVTTALFTFNSVQKVTNTLKGIGFAESLKNIFVLTAEEKAIISLAKAQLTEKNIRFNKLAALKLEIGMTWQLVKAKLAETKAIQASSAALKAHPIFGLVAILTAVISLIGMIASWIKEINIAGDKAAEKLKNAENVTEALSGAAEEANEKYSELLNTIENYDSAIDKLEGLKAGTDEFTQALISANTEARKLIEQYELLPNDYYIDEDGVITFKAGVLEGKKYEQAEKVEMADSLVASAKAAQSALTPEGKYAGSIFQFGDHSLDYIDTTNIYEAIKAAGYESFESFIGTADLQQQKQVIAQGLYGEDANLYMESNSEYLEHLANNMYDAMSGYEKDIISSSSDIINSERLDLINALSNEQDFQNSLYKNFISDEVLNRDYISQYADKSDSTIKAAFAKTLEDTHEYIDGKFYKIGEDGALEEDEQLNETSIEAMREALNRADYTQQRESEAKILANNLEQLNENLSGAESDFANILFNKNYASLDPSEIISMSGLSNDELKNAYPFLKELENFGINADNLLNQLRTDLSEWDPGAVDLSSAREEFVATKKVVEELEFGDVIDEETFKSLGEGFDQYFVKLEDGTYKLITGAETFYNTIMGKSKEDLFNNLKEGKNQLDYLRQQKIQMESDATYEDKINYAEEKGLVTKTEASAMRNNPNDRKNIVKVNSFYNSDEQDKIIADSELDNSETVATILMTSQTLDELKINLEEVGNILNGEILNYEAYSNALINIGSQYENCKAELDSYKTAIAEGNTDTINATEATLEAAIMAGEMAESYDLEAEAIERYAEELELSGKYAKANEKALTHMAKDQLRFDKAVNSAAENMEDWINDLEIAEETGHLVSETAEEMAETYGNLLDIDGSELSAEFLRSAENLEDMQKALEGDEEAYQRLLEAARQDIAFRVGFDDSDFQNQFNEILNEYYTVDSLDDIEIGASLENQGFLDALSEMVTKAGMTANEATDYLSSMGVDANVVTKPETITETVAHELIPTIETVTGPFGEGGTIQFSGVSYTKEPVTIEKEVVGTALEVTSASKSSGGNVKYSGSTAANGGSNSKKSGGGGGGSKPKIAKAPKKSDTVDRYKEIDDKLSENTRSMNKAEKAAEGLWGPERFDKMREGIELLEEENKLLEERLGWSKQYLEEDRAALDKAAAEAGITFTFNADGRISNYTSEMTKLYNELEAATNAANADGNATEEEQEHLDKLQEKIDAVSEAVETYDSTLDEYISDEEQMMENQLEIWEKNLDLLDQELELEIGINESDLEKLEYLLSKVEDNAYDMYEAAALMVGKAGEDGNFDTSGSQLGVYLKELQDYEDHYNKLVESYQNEDISKPQFIEELQNLQSELYDNLGSIQELDETMVHYYGDTLDAAADELSQYTDLMEHHNDVLDHYNNLMELLGNSKDYDRLDEILRSQVAIAENMTEVSKANYEMLAAEAAAREQAWQSAQMNVTMSEYEKEMLKQQWLDAQNAANEAQDQMLSDAEAWAEALKAVLENELSSLSDILNNALSGEFNSLDEMNEAIERKNSLQEEYLTKTNQIYETDKLMRTAQQAIDKSTNDVTKRRLKQFIDETDALQNQTKLSEYELEIQQAKYDLLLAEIALEEAQNAKSTVRLQRDSEGNFGYVYTADQNAVAEAEQELADAQNRLYNIGLEGANDYTQKYLDTLTEMNDELTALTEAWINNEISSWEEYERRKNELTEYYGEKMEQYNDLHSIALTTDTAVVVDAWTSGFADMTDRTEEWMTAVDDYVGKVRDAFSEYENELDKIEEETVGPDLESLEDKTEAITQANEKLVESITQENGILDALAQEITSVQNLAEEYAKLRKEIQGTINDSEGLAKKANDLQHTESDDDPTNDMNYKAPAAEPVETPKSPAQETPSEQPQSKTVAAGAQVNAGSAKIYGQPGAGGDSQYYSNDPVYDVLEVDGEWVRVRHHSLSSGTSGWFRKSDLTAFDSGGYTGDWGGPYGKLAMLHKKELILNEHDTDNFLLTMEVMERILQMLDLQTMSSQFGGLLSSPGLRDTGSQSLEQHIEIEAHFPDATDRIEIEEAFKSMVNLASQYANRK